MSNFLNPPEPEPLSELSWRRVEQKIFKAIDQGLAEPLLLPRSDKQERGSRAGLWLAAAGTLAAAAALVLVVRPALLATPSEVVAVAQRSRVVTQSASSEVLLGDAEIEVAPESAIWIDRAGDHIEVTLDKGGVRLKVAPRSHRAPVIVRAGKVRVEVVGTEFAVYRRQGETQVEVFEGVVSVVAEGKRTQVSAGEFWPLAQNKLERVPQVAKHRQARRGQAQKDDGPAPSAGELFEQAAELESSAPQAAVAIYKQVAAGNGAWAANALYAHGRLQQARGKTAQAASILRRYLKRYPTGANAQDAQQLLDSSAE